MSLYNETMFVIIVVGSLVLVKMVLHYKCQANCSLFAENVHVIGMIFCKWHNGTIHHSLNYYGRLQLLVRTL